MTEFDQINDRRNTNCVKWDSITQTYKKEKLLPFWVADMDFMAPSPVTQALETFVKKGIYGYSIPPESLYQSIIDWQKRRHGYGITKEEILFSPGVVPSIAVAIQAFTEPGDAVLIHDPVYPPFAKMVTANQRKLVRNTLIERNGHFEMDLAAMETQIVDNQIKLFILCNPHNPGGRVWHKEELQAVGRLCQKHQVLVISDEIHEDLIFQPHHHVSFHTVQPDFADFSIVLTAATKTFNLAGIKNSMVFIKNPELKKRFTTQQEKTEQSQINTFGLIGTEAAYREGEVWLTDLLTYLQENLSFACDYFRDQMPKLKVLQPEGTYLLWLDFSAFQLSDKQLQEKLINEAGVVLNPGITFGPGGTQHMRFNIACPRKILAQGLQQIAEAFSE